MNTASLVIGAYLGGYMLPELLLILSHREALKRIPLGANLCTAVSAALIAYGLAA